MLKFSKKSWHYRLVGAIFYEHNIADNICTYFWRVLFSMVFVCCLVVAGLFITFTTIVEPIIYLLACFNMKQWIEFDSALKVGLIVDALVTFCVTIHYILNWLEHRPAQKKPDNFVVESYKKFKYKTCAKIDFE